MLEASEHWKASCRLRSLPLLREMRGIFELNEHFW